MAIVLDIQKWMTHVLDIWVSNFVGTFCIIIEEVVALHNVPC